MKRDNVEVVILGGSGSGKTALMRALDQQPFTENLEHTTDRGYLNPNPTAHDPDPATRLHVVDTPGYQDPRRDYKIYKNVTGNTDAAIICFDTSNSESFEHAKAIHQLVSINSPNSAQILLVGTKTDLPRTETSVSQGQILQYAEAVGIKYVSCSAKTGVDVDQVFETAKSQVLQSRAPKVQPAVAPATIEKTKDNANQKKSGRGSKKPDQKAKAEPTNSRTLEIVLTNVKLSKEQRAEFNANAFQSDAFVMAQTALLNNNKLIDSSSENRLKSGGAIIARTVKSADGGEKIAITVKYSDQNAAKTMEEVANRVFNVAVQQRDPLEIRSSHDDAKLLAAALDKKNLSAKEEVYRVNIQNMPQNLNKYGPPLLFATEVSKKIIQDNDVLKSLQQTLVTPDGKGVMTATANYLPPNPNDRKEYKLENQIQVELRPNAGQALDANTVKAFRSEVEQMTRGGTFTADPSNPAEFNALLTQQLPAQKAAPAVVQQQAQIAAPVQEVKENKRASKVPPPFKQAMQQRNSQVMQRQQSIGELQTYSPRENKQHEATAELLTQAAFEFDKKVELTVESINPVNASSVAAQFAHEQKADVQSISIDSNRTLLSDNHNDFLIDVTQDKHDPKTLHVTVDCRDTDAAENRANKILSDFASSAAVQAKRTEITRDDTSKVAQSIQDKNPKIEVTQVQSATPHK